MTLETLLLFAGIVFAIAVIPGPNALLVLFTALTKSRSLAFANILGVSLGFLIHSLISALGLSLLLAQSAWAFNLLKWLGVLYLTWLGVGHLKSAWRRQVISPPEQRVHLSGIRQNFGKGLLTNLLNPKIVLFYLSIFPQFVSPQHVIADSLLLGGTQAIVVAAWFSLVILLASKIRALLVSGKFSALLNYLSGTLFIGFGIKLATVRL
ncbi:LysE family translocator [Shewanella corallii]|uniref:LysE family translocator n=1 Tax=Shewanella corallii TaxID=560080 RepID=A0ABT0N2P1_9GAMM|nr:LysE family translocator [Shewanella corallii]MCL2912719.1 LysE family translocator [Shewanella corallii]